MAEPTIQESLQLLTQSIITQNLLVQQLLASQAASVLTPHNLGVLPSNATLPIDDYRSIEATVSSNVNVTLPLGVAGTRSTVLLTATADSTITLPSLKWYSPFGRIWDGSIKNGESVRLTFYRSSFNWECVDAVISSTVIPVVTNADEITVDQSGLQVISGTNAQTAIGSADAAINALYSDLYDGAFDAGNKTGAWALSFAETRAVKATLTGNATITLTPPAAPKVVYLDINPGGYAASFATAIKWARAAVPTVPVTAGTSITYILRWTGSEWRGDAEYYGVPA